MKTFTAALVYSLLHISYTAAWHSSPTTKFSRHLSLQVASKESTEIPYVVARGDGSTGGGGLPMPNASKDNGEDDDNDDDGLTRPKVGAEMPQGCVFFQYLLSFCHHSHNSHH